MANLRTAMDSAFWDQPISSPQTLEGCARSIPGDPFPLDATRASRALRIQQLSLMGPGFPFGLIPSYSPTSQKELGSFSLQSALLKLTAADCWLGLIGQFRPKKLFSSIKAELSNAEELDYSVFKDAAKHILDKSLYSMSLLAQLSLTSTTSLLLGTERHGEKKRTRYKMMLYQKLSDHDITLEAGWPELYIDHKGGYWDVPESISLDMSSLTSESGFRYRFGIHKNTGHPQAVNGTNGEAPLALLPGLCAKAAFSYEKSKDFWRKKETKKDLLIKKEQGWFWHTAYDQRMKEPHATISGIIGGTCEAWLSGSESSVHAESNGDGNISVRSEKRSPFSADLFGSVCYTFQHGKFRKRYGDLTRLDARLDICSASALTKKVFNILRRSSDSGESSSLSSPRLNLILQQQIVGPVGFRVDSKFSLGSSPERKGPHMEDLIYSLTCSLRLLRSGKVVAWYSPKRKEGMVELRLFEF
ncbi:hypothetical protein K2173_024477 [Erythroxylum novogranatense]|uniref:Protein TRIGALACTOSYLDIACYLGLYCEROL 4, chloroplastic n=1 Tax=Erythroxylum novogranatense TaxID=1862640 RepID=A0AAV8SUE7_9ROSI|nr:hypothetical protein K2173_024477 [Erythroxylum novogranatense]